MPQRFSDGLNAIVRGLSELAEKLEAAVDEDGVHRVDGERGGVRFGVEVRTGAGDARRPPVGAARPRSTYRAPVDPTAPLQAEVHDMGDRWVIVADMPGVGPADVQIVRDGDVVRIQAESADADGRTRYDGEVLLPGPAVGEPDLSVRNALVRIAFRKPVPAEGAQ